MRFALHVHRYGRGAAGNDTQTKYMQLNKIYLSRPARVQSQISLKDKGRLEGANEYNIWYDKYTGDHWDLGAGKGEQCSIHVCGGVLLDRAIVRMSE